MKRLRSRTRFGLAVMVPFASVVILQYALMPSLGLFARNPLYASIDLVFWYPLLIGLICGLLAQTDAIWASGLSGAAAFLLVTGATDVFWAVAVGVLIAIGGLVGSASATAVLSIRARAMRTRDAAEEVGSPPSEDERGAQ